MAGDPGKRDIGLRALEFEQCGLGHIVLARHAGCGRQHPVTTDKIAALPDPFARKTHRLVILAADKMGITRDTAENRRAWIAWTELQCALGRYTAFLPAPAIRQSEAVVALG